MRRVAFHPEKFGRLKNNPNRTAAWIVSSISESKSAFLSVCEPIQGTTLELRNGCAALGQSLDEVFRELDAMRDELVERFRDVERERLELERREADQSGQPDEAEELRDKLHEREEELSQTRAELARLKEELARREVEAVKEPDESKLEEELCSLQERLESRQEELEATSAERDALKQRIERTESENSRLVSLEAELVEARQQLADLDRAEPNGSDGEGDQRAATVDAERMSALEQERDALEVELEQVRGRAAELNETVTEQQRQIDEQKSEWGGELQQLRRLVEEQADMFAATTKEESRKEASRTRQSAAEPVSGHSRPNDPVVESVMAQFAKLQKDAAHRRQRKSCDASRNE